MKYFQAQKLRHYYDLIKNDYDYEKDYFKDDDKIKKIKFIINNKLKTSEKTILILYAELGTLRRVAELLGVSHSTIYKEIKKIRNKIQKLLKLIK